MNEVVYFQDAVFEICGIFGFALVVSLCFLFHEIRWQKKHPLAFTPQASEDEKKSIRHRMSAFFTFLYVWIFAFVAYLQIKSDFARWPVWVAIGICCLCGIAMSLRSRR